MRILTFAAVTALALIGGCATPPTLTPEQCLATDWTAQGYTDGQVGHGFDWIQNHVEACAKSGVVPDATAYRTGLTQGQRVYCVPARGFRQAARGANYTNGWCPADLEPAFLAGYADGVIVHEAYQRTVTADARLAEVQVSINQIGYDITAAESRLTVEGITEEEVTTLRDRIRRLRRERETAQQALRDQQWAVDESRRAYAETRSRFIPTYGAF